MGGVAKWSNPTNTPPTISFWKDSTMRFANLWIIILVIVALLMVSVASAQTTATKSLVLQSSFVNLPTDTALTSPTVAFSVAGKSVVTLNSDANQTGFYPTGGVTGQIVHIVSGAGENTIQFDDNGTTLALGGNIVLTEDQADCLTLLCTSADPQQWTAIGAHDN